MSNNFYTKSDTIQLPVPDIYVDGEIENPGYVDKEQLALRSVIVKETLPDGEGGNRFIGAYRYDGWSLFDILESRVVKKANEKEFPSVIDLSVVVGNKEGESVTFSWGEIYYPVNLHKIIVACRVSRIVPSKTGEMWELPTTSRMVVSTDLLSVRNISDPSRISIRSSKRSYVVNRGIMPLHSDKAGVFVNNNPAGFLGLSLEDDKNVTFDTIFYGRGRGIHSTTPFTGKLLKEVLASHFQLKPEYLTNGLICVAATDGYRAVISLSELFNRNDQGEFLLMQTPLPENGGLFRIFAAADFFSDRAVKAICEIHIDF